MAYKKMSNFNDVLWIQRVQTDPFKHADDTPLAVQSSHAPILHLNFGFAVNICQLLRSCRLNLLSAIAVFILTLTKCAHCHNEILIQVRMKFI
jgi:hypothetical protein